MKAKKKSRVKVLPGRRRKKASKGRVIRISDDVYKILNERRLKGLRLSWDEYIRRMIGLPTRKGEPQILLEGFLEKNTGKFFLDEAEARGQSVLEAARKKTKKFLAPIKMREVP